MGGLRCSGTTIAPRDGWWCCAAGAGTALGVLHGAPRCEAVPEPCPVGDIPRSEGRGIWALLYLTAVC